MSFKTLNSSGDDLKLKSKLGPERQPGSPKSLKHMQERYAKKAQTNTKYFNGLDLALNSELSLCRTVYL